MAREKKYGGLESYCSRKNANFVILPVPLELTTSYIKGTHRGPKAILEASAYMELYDEELDTEPYLSGIYTAGTIQASKNMKSWFKAIYSNIRSIISEKKIPVVIGGEHSVSFGVVKALQKCGVKDLSVLQLDAHADLRNSFENNIYSHACVGRRISEICPLTQSGIRSQSKEEADFKKDSSITTFYASKCLAENTLKKIVTSLTKKVYITIDIDVFDPAYVPAVGTPEPGGLSWYEVLNILRMVTLRKQVVGFDVVELCPMKGDVSSDFLAAKLIYKLIGYILEGGSKSWKY